MRFLKRTALLTALAGCFGLAGWAATFGTVIPIGGHAADVALDEQRGRLYVANFTANRIEVIDTASNKLLAPIDTRPAFQPDTLALSSDGRYLVIGHYNTFAQGFGPDSSRPAITILDLQTGNRRFIPRDPVPSFWKAPDPYPPDPSPVAIAFGSGSQALVISNRQPDPTKPQPGPSFELLDPVTGTRTPLRAVQIDSTGLPVPFATFPPEIIEASAGVSGDGNTIYAIAQASDKSVLAEYHVGDGLITLGVSSAPALGPAVVSVDRTGSSFLAGWTLSNSKFVLLAQFPYTTGRLNLGSHAFDDSRNLIYANIPTPTETSGDPSTLPAPGVDGPVLTIMDSDNLTVRERIRLRESLAGKSLLSSNRQVMYSISDSGITVLPIGSLVQTRRVTTMQEDLFFPVGASVPSVLSRDLDVVDPGGGATDFHLSTSASGVRITPDSGTTPARVRVDVDPVSFFNAAGTTAASLDIQSSAAINIPFPVRLLINNRGPDQVGTIFNVPGKLVDILADPVRNVFYVLRQDKNLVLVFDGTSFAQLPTTLRTGNTPTQMAMTKGGNSLIVGNDNSQIANVFDLNLLQSSPFIVFPGGHYPRSIAVSNNALLAASRVAGNCLQVPVQTTHCIDRIDFAGRTASPPPTLGIFKNDVNIATLMTASPSGQSIFIVMPDGTLALYDATADTFVASRHDLGSISGAFAALTDQLFVADNNLVNWSLVPITKLETSTGSSAGMTISQDFGLRITSPSPTAPGIIQRVNLTTFTSVRPIPMAESPVLVTSLPTPPIGQVGQTILPFLRTLAPLSNQASIIALTISGFTVLPKDFDGGTGRGGGPGSTTGPVPSIDRVVNFADGAAGVAPGGLVSIFGANFADGNSNSNGLPLPTTLGNISVTANKIPLALLAVSPSRIDAQLPFNVVGTAALEVRTANGVNSPFSFAILAGAPAVFRTGTAGPLTALPTVYRTTNNELATLSNPIHPNDSVIIYATGLGLTSPAVESGTAAPSNPLAAASQQPIVTLGGVPLLVSFAGLAPGEVGVYQINAFVPDNVPQGLELPLTIGQGTYTTTLSVRVVK